MAKKILFFEKLALFFICVLIIIPFLVMAQPQTAQASSHPGRNIVIVLSRILTDIQILIEKFFSNFGPSAQPNNSKFQEEATSTRAGRAMFDLGQGFLKQADQMVTSDEIKALSQQQLDSTKGIVQSINNIQSRSRLETFIFGPDYTDLNQIDQEVNRIGNKIIELNKAAEQTSTSSDQQDLQNQIRQLTQQKTQLDNFINENKNAISLFSLIKGVLGF
jgi:hypothetical protein